MDITRLGDHKRYSRIKQAGLFTEKKNYNMLPGHVRLELGAKNTESAQQTCGNGSSSVEFASVLLLHLRESLGLDVVQQVYALEIYTNSRRRHTGIISMSHRRRLRHGSFARLVLNGIKLLAFQEHPV